MTSVEETHAAGTTTHAEEEGALAHGAIGVWGVVMQNIANIAPAIAALFTIQSIVGFAGVTAPLAYVLAFFVTLASGYVLAQLANHLPSSGSYFTYISRTLHPRLGFLAAWLYFFAFPLVGAQAGDAMGSTVESTLKTEYGFTFPWWVFLIIAIVATAVFTYPGIRVGIRALFVLSAFELIVIFALAISGLISPGPGGFSFDGFSPSNGPNFSQFWLGVTFAIFALTGWDAAAPLAEESKAPRRTIGRGVLTSIIIMGAFLVISSWGLTVGWGTHRLDGLVNASENPGFGLAHRVWGGAWIIVLLALANSTIAVLISSMNASTRVWWRMAHVGVLPSFLGQTHDRFKTPTNAILFQTAISIGLGLVLGLLWGVTNVFTVLGFLFTFAVIPAWVLACLGVYRLYRREHREEFHWFKHIVVPLFSAAGLLWVGYKSIIPLPPAPSNAAPIIVGIWLLVGIGVLLWIRARGNEESFMHKAGLAMDESSQPDVSH